MSWQISHQDNTTIECEVCPASKALFRCQDCNQNLCEVCLTYHQKFNGTCQHTVCAIPINQSASCPDCLQHDRKFEYHCQDDGMNCCRVCKDTCHSKCKSVMHFDDCIKEKEKLMQDCEGMKQKIERLKIETNKHFKIAKKKTENWIRRIKDQLAKMQAAMKELEGKVEVKENNLENIISRRQKENEKLIATYSDTIQEFECKRIKLITAAQTNSDVTLVMAIQEMKEVLHKHRSLKNENPCEGHTIEFLKEEHRFEAEHYVTKTLEEMMETASSINSIYVEMQRNSLQTETPEQDKEETVQIRPSDEEYLEKLAKPTARHRTLSEREKVEHYQSLIPVKECDPVPMIPVQKQCTTNIQMPDDNEICTITGIAELSKNKIIMADFLNTKLKLLDESGKIIDSVKTTEKPRDIAVIDGNNVMVSIPMGKKIQFVEIYEDNVTRTSKMTLVKTYDVDGKCCGIAYQDNKIYTATQNPTQILILDLSGEVLQKISGERLFERPTYTTVAPDGSLIYMSDPNHKYVYGLTKDGVISFRYKVEGPHGITTNEKGELFIADFDTGSIHLVSREGKKIAELCPENCHCPQKVFYNKNTQTLLVTMWSSNVILIFQLK